MANLTGKTIAELTEATVVNTSDLFLLSRNGTSYKITGTNLIGGKLSTSGGTLTGTLYIQDDSIPGTPTEAKSSTPIAFRNAESKAIGYVRGRVLSDGSFGVGVESWSSKNQSGNVNRLYVGWDGNGNRLVTLNPTAWRNALLTGITEGEDPVSDWITALGFQKATVTPSMASPLPAAVTSASVVCRRSGYVVMVTLNVTIASTTTSWQTIATGLPATSTGAAIFHDITRYDSEGVQNTMRIEITSGGNLLVTRGVSGQQYQGTFTYIADSLT